MERLLRSCPDYAEAWNKRATLYYLQQRDEESVRDIHRTLELEPRHFGALCGLGEILVSEGEYEDALFVFLAALRLNPHLEGARSTVEQILAGDATSAGETGSRPRASASRSASLRAGRERGAHGARRARPAAPALQAQA